MRHTRQTADTTTPPLPGKPVADDGDVGDLPELLHLPGGQRPALLRAGGVPAALAAGLEEDFSGFWPG